MPTGKSVFFAASLAVVAALGCASDEPPAEEGCTGDQCDQGSGGGVSAHRKAVVACDAKLKADLDEDSSTLGMRLALDGLNQCLVAANDATVAAIEAAVAESADHLKGMVAGELANLRALDLCSFLLESSADSEGTAGTVMVLDCIATVEHTLADTIDSHVVFGDAELTRIDEPRMAHAACYAAFDKAVDEGMSQADFNQASFALADCVFAELSTTVADRVVAGLVSIHPEVAEPAHRMRVKEGIDKVLESAAGLCEIAAEAGQNGGGSLARSEAGTCEAEFLAAVIKISAGF